MTSKSENENAYIAKLDDKVKTYNNTYHKTIKMKAVDVKSSTYIDFNKENNKEAPKFKVGDHVRISRYKHIFAKGYTSNQSEEVFVIKKVKHTVPWIYVINDLNDEETLGTFYGKESQKEIQKEFRIEKVIKKKGSKLYAKSKGFDDSFNSWIDKKNVAK